MQSYECVHTEPPKESTHVEEEDLDESEAGRGGDEERDEL
jgi:hypothetical protein